MVKVFIDGRSGTTGLKIDVRLADRRDLNQIILPDEVRKDLAARADALNSCDVAILCLPDAAARESAAMIDNPAVKVIDTSTAHRTADGWVYGFPELSAAQHAAVQTAQRVAVPGCHASGFIALVRPLIDAGLLPADSLLTCHSLTGYSGGGKQMIADYESKTRDAALGAPRQYGLTQEHKHLKEMRLICGLDAAPVFCPIVADYFSGMLVTVPLFKAQLKPGFGKSDIQAVYSGLYTGPAVSYQPSLEQGGMVNALDLSGKDSMLISVSGNEDRMILMAQFDNLGKGASGAAVQCLNLMTGADPNLSMVF